MTGSTMRVIRLKTDRKFILKKFGVKNLVTDGDKNYDFTNYIHKF